MDFYRVEHHTIMSGLVVRYRIIGQAAGSFEVSASRSGVLIQGTSPDLNQHSAADVRTVIERASWVAEFIRRGELDIPAFSFQHDPQCVVSLRKAHFAAEDEEVERRERQVI